MSALMNVARVVSTGEMPVPVVVAVVEEQLSMSALMNAAKVVRVSAGVWLGSAEGGCSAEGGWCGGPGAMVGREAR